MTTESRFHFQVYETEPVIKAIASCKHVTPVRLGILFFLLVSLTLTVWAVVTGGENTDAYVTYLENISWSISLLYLFPFVIGLTLRFYQGIPDLFEFLFENTLQEKQPEQIDNFRKWLAARFNGYLHPVVFMGATFVLNYLYFSQILDRENPSWMVGGPILMDVLSSRQGLTPVGAYAALIQVVLIYWALVLIWKAVIFSWGLHEFFNAGKFNIKLDLWHPDGSCGLKRISSTCMFFNYILLLFGVYISLKVIDKIMVQNLPLFSDIGNPLMLGGYAILAPLLFFFPLGAPHYKMKAEKERLISRISQKEKMLFEELIHADFQNANLENGIKIFEKLEETRNNLIQTIPVWPFNFKSIEAFLGMIVIPLLPSFLSLLVNFFIGINK